MPYVIPRKLTNSQILPQPVRTKCARSTVPTSSVLLTADAWEGREERVEVIGGKSEEGGGGGDVHEAHKSHGGLACLP